MKPRSELRRLWELVAPHKGWILISVLSMVGYNIFNAAPVYYLKDIFDAMEKKPEIEDYYIVGIGIILVFSLKGLFHFGQTYSMGLVVQRLLTHLRQALFDHLQRLSLSFYAKHRTGDLTSRFTNDIQSLQAALNVGITGPFKDFPSIFIFLGIMIYRSWQLALLTAVVIPVALLCIKLFGRRNKTAVGQRQASYGELTSVLVETITGVRVVKAFGMENYEIERFRESNQRLYNNNMRSISITSYSTPVIEVIGAAAGACIVVYGGYLVINEVITFGDMVSFFGSFFMLNDPVKGLNGFNLKLQEGLAALQRLFFVLDSQPDIQNKPNAKPIQALEHEIEINIVRFQYEAQNTPAIADFHLTVSKGEVVALVGSSGAGKTTFINLIPRFYDVNEGSIKIDGQDLRDLDLVALRELMAIVTQETILFNDTIANNITYGHPNCPQEKMEAAAKAANAHEFILSQPEGYQTYIGEKGVKLSGGQRQRIAIARALLKDAPILILDEATSALDSESEIEVQQAIDHLMQNRTSFVIAHRLSTIRHAHRICVLESGRIIEIGTHDELLKKSGRYKELYEMQFRHQSLE